MKGPQKSLFSEYIDLTWRNYFHKFHSERYRLGPLPCKFWRSKRKDFQRYKGKCYKPHEIANPLAF